MNDYGMGLILSFTDNATSGIESAVNSLNQLTQVAESAGNKLNDLAGLTAFSSIANSFGTGMVDAGRNILSVFAEIINKVNETGTTLLFAENQLSKLYEGSSRTGKDVLKDISQYAKTSIFEFEDLIPVVTMLKANGIEAFDEIASSTNKSRQTLMDYAADLAAFNPQMRNTYGTGIRAAMGALNEYIAEGNARSLKAGASLDITGILGEEKGSTIEERSRQVADLLEKLNMVGMTATLAQSPMTKLSNMHDTLFQFTGMVSESGVYDSYLKIVSVLSDFVTGLDDSRLKNLANIVGSSLSAIMKPLETFAEKFVVMSEKLLTFLEQNPKFAKFATIAVAMSGALLVSGGVILKFAGSLGYLTLMLKSLNPAFTSIGAVVKMGAKKVFTSLLPLTLLFTGMYFAWKHDFFGIRSLVTGFFGGIGSAFDKANNALSGDVRQLRKSLHALDKDSFFDNIALTVTKLKVVFSALKDAWSDFELDEDTFLKAQELGVLPLIDALLNFKYRFGIFKDGFLDGMKEVRDGVVGFTTTITSKFKGTFLEGIITKFSTLLNKLSRNDTDAWYSAGKGLSKFAAGLTALWISMKAFRGVSKIFGKGSIASMVVNTVTGGKKGKNADVTNIVKQSIFSNPKDVLKVMGSMGIILGGTTLFLTALGAFTSVPEFKTMLRGGIKEVKLFFDAIIPLATSIGGMGVLVKAFSAMNINAKNSYEAMKSFAVVLGGMEAILLAFGALHQIEGFDKVISDGGKSLGVLTKAIENLFNLKAGVIVAGAEVLGLLPEGTAMAGMKSLATLIGGFGLIVSAFGALNLIEGFDKFIDGGGDLLATLFEQLGKIFGRIVAAFTTAVTSGLPDIGENISAFGMNLKPFFGAVEGIDSHSISEFMHALGDMILVLSGEKIVSFIAGDIDLPALGTRLSGFGINALPFFLLVNTLPEKAFSKASAMFNSLQGLNNYSLKSGGLAQIATGTLNLASVGRQLNTFIENAKPFYENVMSISDGAFRKAELVFNSLRGLALYELKMGGLAQLASGTLSLDKVGSQLSSFAIDSAYFFYKVAGMKDKEFSKAEKMFKSLNGLDNYAFKMGGLAQLASGTLSLDKVGSQLSSFAINSILFYHIVSNLKDSTLDKVEKLFTTLGLINAYDFKSGGLAQIFSGTISIASVGTQLTNFVVNAKDFFTYVAGMKDSTITMASKVLGILSTIGENQDVLDDMGASWGSLSSIGTDLSNFTKNGADFWKFISETSDIDVSNASGLLSILGHLRGLPDNASNLINLGKDLSVFALTSTLFFNMLKSLSTENVENGSKISTMIGDLVSSLNAVNNSTVNLPYVKEQLKQFSVVVNEFADSLNENKKYGVLSTLSKHLDMFVGSINKASRTFNNAVRMLSNGASTLETTFKMKFNSLRSTVDTQTLRMKDSALVNFNMMKNGSISIMQDMYASINKILRDIQWKFMSVKFSIPQRRIALPHFKISGGFNTFPPTVPKLSVEWYKRGGIFDEPSLIGVGESGSEAVMPLEKNTGWIDLLADKIDNRLAVNRNGFTPVNTSPMLASPSEFAKPSGSIPNYYNENDNSVVFNEGAIQIVCKDTSEEEAYRFAKKVMDIIKRQRELNKMALYEF